MENVESVYPLSPSQQGMLFESVHKPAENHYFRQFHFELAGAVNSTHLRAAWQNAVDRHGILRSSFLWEGVKEPVQIVHQQVQLPWEERDWSALDGAAQSRMLAAFLVEDQRRSFQLDSAPLVRCTLLHRNPQLSWFVFSFHHAVLDGWSVPLVVRDVLKALDALREGSAPDQSPAPAYRNYISWLRRQDSAAAQRFWSEYLNKASVPTPLGIDTKSAEGRGAIEEVSLRAGEQLASALRETARRQRVTLNTLVQAAWAVVLSRYSGQSDVVFGAATSGRPTDLPRVDEIAGVFINVLPVRARVTEGTTVREFLQSVQREQSEARQYEYASLTDIRSWCGVRVKRELFESLLIFENFPDSELLQGGAGSFQIRGAQSLERTHYPLTIMAGPAAGDLHIAAIYDTQRFDGAIASKIPGHILAVLESMAANPGGVVATLGILTKSELERITVQWNETAAEIPVQHTVHGWFEAQAWAVPSSTAVTFEDSVWTYAQLNQRANRLANYLLRAGAQRGSAIAVCMDRSAEMLAALLAIQKTGAFYIPVDPDYPADRVAYMLDDSAAALVVTDARTSRTISVPGVRPICIHTERRNISAEPDSNPACQVEGDDLAYMIYTSGSTGRPKGVMVKHVGVVNLLLSMSRTPGFTSRDRLLAITTLSFDIAALELYLPLVTGGSVVIATRDVARDAERLTRMLQRTKATVMQATPVTWRMLIQAGWRGDPALKILCGGEPLPRDLADDLLQRCGSLWNVYGPTETTIWSTVAEVKSGMPVTIGRPIDNTTIFILDANLQPVPAGVAGELYIGGLGVARGYWNRTELTAERFRPNPFGPPDDLIYRTGDIARYTSDGNIECLGRVDHQVKIRGFRIELGEIEAALRAHPAILEAAVVARGAGTEDPRLSAYVVPSKAAPPSAGDLREHLRSILPAYMVPATFTVLESLPVTPNGKVDRKALPEPEADTPPPEQSYVAPEYELEAPLAELFEQVLKVPTVGMNDSFFDLGGHSILALRLFSDIEKTLGIRLPVATLFEAPTVRQLAAALRSAGGTASWASIVTLKPGGSGTPFFCVHSLGANLLSYRRFATLIDDRPVYGLQPVGLDGENEPHLTVEEMAAHYISEVRAIQPNGPYYLGGVCLGGTVAFEMAQQLQAQGEETALLALIDTFMAHGHEICERIAHVTPSFVVDYYAGNVLLQSSPGTKLGYLLTRARNAVLLGLRMIRRAAGVERPGELDKARERIMTLHSAAERNYYPKFYAGRVTLFWCSEFPARAYLDSRVAWSEVAGEGLEIHAVPGNHTTMLDGANGETLARKLNNCLARASSQSDHHRVRRASV